MATSGKSQPTLFFSAGEASGDAYVHALASRLKFADMHGVGSVKSQSAGVQLVANSGDWGALGIFEALKVYPRVRRGFVAAKKFLSTHKPGIFIPIDYGYMNVKLGKYAKAHGWKVVYFIPPGSWRRNKQGSDLPTFTDAIITPFSWSADLLNQAGANAHWFGHPLKQMVRENSAQSAERSGIAILPGSRKHEIENNLPVIHQVVKYWDLPLRFGVAANVNIKNLESEWKSLGGRDADFSHETHSMLLQSQAGIICSGTATLESAICDCPCVVMYRGSKMMEIEYRIRKPKFDYISLPNILLDQGLLPEMIQWDATPENLKKNLEPLLSETPDREAQIKGFQKLNEILGPDDALDRSVELIQQISQS
ncbi:MAG: hypothetical protein KDC26_04135 [Armatimonadetes bacterium]|nr:hypothetical protein [Armatimonadota bacterium]